MDTVDDSPSPAACSIAVGTNDTTQVTDRTRAWPLDEGSDDAPLPRGARVGRYLVLDELGRGGMGIVYRAYDPQLDRPLALKRLRGRDVPLDSPAHARLRREAQTLARLSDPHVVTIYDVGQDEAGLFIAMELVEGEDLAGWLERGPHPWPAVVERLAAAGRGLAAAHRVGVVHRDFKPANVLLDAHGRVAVTDFGLARPEAVATDDSSSDAAPALEPLDVRGPALTAAGVRVGTPMYMAPEQHAGRAADARADQYAFCVALFEGLYGCRPFSGADAETLAEHKRKGALSWPEDGVRRPVPTWLRRTLARGLQPDPAQRFASMEALLAQLEPSARRRSTIAAAVVIVLATTAIVGVSHGHAELDPCEGSSSALGSTWDATTREATAAGLAAVALPYAARAAETTTAALDAWTERWSTTHRALCEATWRSGTQSSEALDVRMACLLEQRRALAATVAALHDATPQVVEHVTELVTGLPDPEACVELVPRPEPAAAPDDPGVARAREQLAELEALRRSGRGREALELAEVLAREIGAGLDPETSVALHYARGVLQDDAGDFGAAQQSLQDAAGLARRMGDARREAEAWIELTRVVGTHQHDASQGRFFGALALGAIEAAGGDRSLRGYALLELGEVEFRAGDDANAEARWKEAEALRREQYGEHDVRVAQLWSRLAGVDLRRGDMAGARTRLEAVIERYAESYGSEHPRMAAPLGNLGFVLSAQGEHEAAVEHMRRATAIAERNRGPHHPQVAGGHDAIGQTLLHAGQPAAAEPELEAAVAGFDRSLGPEHPAVTEPLLSLGQARLALGRPDDAAAPLERALTLAVAVDLPPVQLADTRFALARALDTREPARAVQLARAALESYAQLLRPDDERWPTLHAWQRSHAEAPSTAPRP